MLNQLLSSEIEKARPQRKKLISAILLGGNVTVKKGKDVGGDFKRTPLCRSDEQIGCVIAFSTFNQTPPEDVAVRPYRRPVRDDAAGRGPGRLQGRLHRTRPTLGDGSPGSRRSLAASRSRARSASGSRSCTAATLRPPTRPGSPRRITTPGQVRLHRRRQLLMLSPVAGAKVLTPSPTPGWGLHLLDANVALGNLVDIVRSQGKRYLKQH